MKGLFYSSYLSMFLLLSCNKNIADDYPKEPKCERFAGKYLMYDPDSSIYYEMIITCDPFEENWTNSMDSVHFSNYGNLFDFGHRVGGNGEISGTNIQPLVDKYGRNWNFSNAHGFDYENRINVLVGDSLYIDLDYDNTAYWISEGVPYQNIETVHFGVKIH